jgi:hypothetical protein
MRNFLVFSIILFSFQIIEAQSKEQMEVIKDYKADIPETPRFELNANLLPSDTSARKQKYNLILRPFEVSYLTPNLKPLRMISEENPANYPGFLLLGIGLPLNRNVVGHYALSPNPQSIVSIDMEHYGMDNHKVNENQKFSNSSGKVKADVFTKAGYTLSGDFNYGQQNRYFYGYNQYNIENNKTSTFLSADVRRQFQDFGGKISFFNHLPTVGKLDYRADIEAQSFSDNLKNKENGFRAKLGLAYWLSETHALSVEILTDLTKYKFDIDTAQRLNQLFISPNYSFHSDNFKINIGAKLGLNNGKTVILPNIEGSYNLLSDKLAIYLGAKGDVEKQNFRLLATENPFLINNVDIRNSNNSEIYAGIKGQTGALSFRIDGGYRKTDHLPIYLTNHDSIPKFKVIYDTATLLSFGGEFNYLIKDNINLRAALKQRIYSLNNEPRAWHLPSFTAMLGIRYTKNKFSINLDVNTESGVPYLASEGPLNLDPLLEVNIGSQYSFTKNIEAFINLNNLLNNKRQRWQYYENIGINFLGGVKMRF